jgi:glycosyltransferase involved in cell wall biosynthesis
MQTTLQFKGSVKVDEYLPEVDVLALSSISEAQPLVILEAGAAGIPCVVTDVGNCRELIYGTDTEEPMLGQGGEIVSISNPQEMSDALLALLLDKQKHREYSQAIKERVHRYYNRAQHNGAYQNLYQSLMGEKVRV